VLLRYAPLDSERGSSLNAHSAGLQVRCGHAEDVWGFSESEAVADGPFGELLF
jgi:hypothetical protein